MKLKPETFDLLGVLTFPFILVVAIWMLNTNQAPPLWLKIIFLIIGVLGTIIDGTIVYIEFIKKKEKVFG